MADKINQAFDQMTVKADGTVVVEFNNYSEIGIKL